MDEPKKPDPCIHCGNTGYLYQEDYVLHRSGRKDKFPINRVPCICTRNRELTKYHQLKDIPFITQEIVNTFKVFKNVKYVIFVNTPPALFYKMVKIRLIMHDKPYEKKLIISSNEFVEKFFLPTENHQDERRVSENGYYDFIFLTLDSGIIRPSTKTVMHELINYRVFDNNPLWISTKHSEIVQSSEYTPEMNGLLETFICYDLKNKRRVNLKTSLTDFQKINDTTV